MVGAILVLALMDRGTGYFFSLGTVFSVMQLFATLGLVALGLGLSMLVREFDLSVAGMVGLAGCIAVMTGACKSLARLLLGVGAGVVSGVLQGLIMTRLGLSSVGVTLGGLLTLQGMTYVLTENKTIGYPNMAVALGLNAPIAGLLSVRSAAALAVFAVAALVMTYTHIGRDMIATGSDRRASRIAGLNTDRVDHRRIRSLRRIRGARGRAAQLQPRRRLASGARRRACARRGGGDRRRRIGRRRARQPDGHRRGRAYALHPALWLQRHRRGAACARSCHRRHSCGHRHSRRARADPARHGLAPRRAERWAGSCEESA